MSDNSFDSDDSSFSDTGDTRTSSGRRRKNSKSRTHPKFRHKGAESESTRGNSRTKPTANGSAGSKKEAKIRLNCCKLCDFTSPKPSAVQKHLHKVCKISPWRVLTFGDFLADFYKVFLGPSHRLCHIRYDKDKNHSKFDFDKSSFKSDEQPSSSQ